MSKSKPITAKEVRKIIREELANLYWKLSDDSEPIKTQTYEDLFTGDSDE